jgi:hypothetical protein
MNTEELLKSLQRWLRSDKENAAGVDTTGSEGPPSEGAGGDNTHETNHPKDPAGGRRE